MNSRRPRVVVVGGGLAGLAAGLEAADRGAAVTLLERRPRLGGATWSFRRKGIWYDNGQHVFLRCCTAYLEFLERIGSIGDVTIQKRLNIPVLRPGGKAGTIRRTFGPAPLHLVPSLLTYPHVSLRARLKVLAAGRALRRLDPEDPTLDRVSFGDWLAARGQPAEAVERFWDLVVLPTVNVHARDASLKLAAKVFVTGLLTDAASADIGWASVPLSALHGDAGRRALEARGAEVVTRAAVSAVRSGSGERPSVTVNGRSIEADSVVGAMLPSGAVPFQDRLHRLGVSPIVNVHLVYERPITDLPMFAAVGSDIQYVFDRTGAAGLDDGRQCLAISLSAADSHLGASAAELVKHFVAAMERLLPAAAGAVVTESMVTREPRATFRGEPGTHPLRAGAGCDVPGVFLAGAWSDTGWPATMEGAVRSGVEAGRRAARFALRDGNLVPETASPAGEGARM